MTALLLLGIALAAGEASAQRGPSAPDSPARALEDLVASAHAKNADAFLARLTQDSRRALLESFAQAAALGASRDAFERALALRFGDRCRARPARRAPALADYLGTLVAAELESEHSGPGGDVVLVVKTTVRTARGRAVVERATLAARREGGVWRIVHPVAAHRQQRMALAARLESAAERASRDVEAGRFGECGDATAALARAELDAAGRHGGRR